MAERSAEILQKIPQTGDMMFDWWSDLPGWLRLLVALGMMIGGGVIFWFVSIRLGLAIAAVGFAMFILGGPDKAEKQGYKF